MASNKAKHHAREDGLREVESTVTTGRGGPQGCGNVLLDGGTSSTTFGLETWVLLADMERNVEVTHTRFCRQITKKRARPIASRTWEMPRAELVWKATGTQL